VGETRPRPDLYTGRPETLGIGICRPPIETCTILDTSVAENVPQFVLTDEEVTPRTEIVGDGIDQNCDGYDDTCALGDEPIITYSGDPEELEHGCQPEIQECLDRGEGVHYYITQEEITARPEILDDGIDQDCDGFDDVCIEDREIRSYSADPGTIGVGICQERILTCQDRGEGLQYYETQPERTPTGEICDGFDNDCAGPTLAEQWNRVFGAETYDSFSSILPTSDGGFVMVGAIASDGWVVKTDSEGIAQWSRLFNTELGAGRFSEIQAVGDEGFIVVGYTNFAGEEICNGWLVKIDNEGSEVWNRTYEGERVCSYLTSVQPTRDGGFIAAGGTHYAFNWNAWVIKVNREGIEEWDRTYGGEGRQNFSSIRITGDGGFIVSGDTAASVPEFRMSWIVRLNSEGIELWNRTFDIGLGDDFLSEIQTTSDGGFIAVGGLTPPITEGTHDGWIVRINSEGVEQWNRTIGGTDTDFFTSVQTTSDSGFIAVGLSGLLWLGAPEELYGWLVTFNEDGIEQENRLISGFGGFDEFEGYARSTSIQPVSGGGYILSGYTFSGSMDGWAVRLCEE